MPYVTDTHPLVWHLTRSRRLSRQAAALFEAADTGRELIYVPTIVLGELLYVSEAGHVPVKFSETLKRIRAGDNFEIVPLDLPVIEATAEIGSNLEMHDRFIVATARVLDVPLITFDEAVTSAGVVEVVW